jgi:DNA polymerase-3 subunit alpha|tara:strand:- start:4273 stop:6831 length:2559 start_codon:yes stop_codon:yes gene_type:complete
MFEDFTPYDDCEPAGVELPKTIVDPTKLEEIGLGPDSSTKEILYELARKGLRDKGITKYENKKVYFDRAKQELETFEELGFTDYILLNWDVLNFCHDNNIPTGAGRGSAAGSLVLYLLGVTNIDPIPHDLFFERFVSKSRAKKVTDKRGKEFLVGSLLPDVDSDISYEQRYKVIQYIERKHEGKTAKILTFNTFSAKLCIREATKYFDEVKEDQANQVSDMIPKLHGNVFPLEQAREESGKFKRWAREHKRTFKNALKIENLPKNTGVHPSGIAICSEKIENVVPLQKTKDGDLVTGYDMSDVADLMVKFDILGLRTLTIAHKTCEKVGIKIEDVDPNSQIIYDILQDFRHPVGLFQISAETNFKVCRQIKPDDLNELSDVVALARPAALEFVDTYRDNKNNSLVQEIHPELDKILSWSKNVILYQEQLMQIAHKVFGLTLEEAEVLRRIVGKKKVDEMPKWKDRIYEAARSRDLTDQIADFYWNSLIAASHYSFNKSHSFAYADLAAKTVFLKHNYPKEFFLSVLECAEFDPEPLTTISGVNEELEDFGMKMLPPCLFKSDFDFKIEGENIRYGLNSIKGISLKAMESLVEFRGIEFSNKYEVFLAARQCGINISVLAALIQAGTMDHAGTNRTRMVLEAQAFNLLTDREKRNFCKIGERFGYDILDAISEVIGKEILGDDNKPIMSEKRFKTFKTKFDQYKKIYSQNRKHEMFAKWRYESSLLGYSYSHDLRECFKERYPNLQDLKVISELPEREQFQVAGEVKDFFTRTSQNGNKYMIISLADNTATKNFLFMDTSRGNKLTDFLQYNKLKKTQVIIVNGSKSRDSFFVETIKPIDTDIYMKLREVKSD